MKSSAKSKKKIVTITEGGLIKGLGHIYRSLFLAEELSKFGIVEFLIWGNDIAIKKIKNKKFKVIKVNNIFQIQKNLLLRKPDIVIIDKFGVSIQLAKFIKTRLDAKLIIFGNSSSANRYADLVVNAVVDSKFKNDPFHDKRSNTVCLKGPRHLVLNKKIYKLHNTYRHRNKLKIILLTFGGSDQSNLTSKVLEKLLNIDHNFKINIVLGPLFKFNDKLRKILKKHKEQKRNIKIYKDIEDVFKLMTEADLVITSPGSTMFESFYIGSPTIAFYQSKLQKKIFNGFIMTYNLDDVKNFKNLILTLYRNYHQNKKRIDKLDIGGGKDKIIESILNPAKIFL